MAKPKARSKPKRPVVVFGAGATKACGGPLTNEILPEAFRHIDEIRREGYEELLNAFLVENFHVTPQILARKPDDYPALPLLMSLIDTAIDRKNSFGSDWPWSRLIEVRNSLEYLVFALIELKLRRLGRNEYKHFLRKLVEESDAEPLVISLNYDLIADNVLFQMCEERTSSARSPTVPDYGCDIRTPLYLKATERFGRLLKIHGSLNWLYCPSCQRLDIGLSESGRRTLKQLDRLYMQDSDSLEARYSCHGSPCVECGTFVRPVLITPTHHKDYRNPHIARAWYDAERTLREADRVFFVGYSLPDDDVEVIYLLKRGLSHMTDRARDITVVEYDAEQRPLRENPVGMRYRSLFGDELDWQTGGFGGWLQGHESGGLSLLSDRLPR